MTLNQFTLFAAVAKHSNVRKASQELRVSQPSVSQQLKQLEDRYGLKLYRRLSKGIEITEQGRAFLRNITPILEQVAKLENGVKSPVATATRETLRTGGTFTTCTILLPVLLARLQQLHPQAELECRTRSSEQLERLVIKSAMDVAVLARPSTARELAIERLRLEKIVAFVPLDHPLAQKKNLKLQNLVGETFIIRGGSGIAGTTEKALKRLQERGLGIKIGLRCEDPMAVRAAVRQGMGVGMGFEDTIKAEVNAGEMKILRVSGLQLEASSFIVYSKQRPLSALAQEFLELLRTARDRE
ncbi:MAG TPA: LysR family transcriptional regulator [Candidatus Saccharimonadales bacterium]|nr:LysR family transcriptional regulator [Candidatus Saccharimonadales bacterium]